MSGDFWLYMNNREDQAIWITSFRRFSPVRQAAREAARHEELAFSLPPQHMAPVRYAAVAGWSVSDSRF
jgi:hypothetical protein